MSTKQTRIILWCSPRSLSTAFYRAINNVPGTLGIFELYCAAFTHGEERQVFHSDTPIKPGLKYKEVRDKLNRTYPGYNTVFVKDMAYGIMCSPYNVEDVLPDGYIHTFLIRDPRKSVPSMYKMCTSPEISGWDFFDSKQAGLKDVYTLYKHLTNQCGRECLIIDADDLQENPEAVFRTYCEFVGIPFNPSMVQWDLADSSRFDEFKESTRDWKEACFQNAIDSTSFSRLDRQKKPDTTGLPQNVQDCIAEQMIYYELLCKENCYYSMCDRVPK